MSLAGLDETCTLRLSKATHEKSKFGWNIDISKLRPGDVVLFSSSIQQKSDISSKAIIRFQRSLYPNDDLAIWTHVGILDAKLFVWDAWPKNNIRRYHIESWLGDYDQMHVRRWKSRTLDTKRLMMFLRKNSASVYSFSPQDMARLSARLLGADASRLSNANENSVICSKYVDQALTFAGHSHPFPAVPIAVPADFAASSRFLSVRCKIELRKHGGAERSSERK